MSSAPFLCAFSTPRFVLQFSTFISQKNWKRIAELLAFAEEDNLSLNAQSYAGILDCLGRKRNRNSVHIEDHIKNMQNKVK